MASVNTVRGPIDTSELGQVLMHEHIFILSPDIMQNYDTGWREEERVEDAIAKLRALKAAGIDTLVDQTPVGYGRFIPRIQRIAERVDLHIIVATGLIDFYDTPPYFAVRGPGLPVDMPEPLVHMFVTDIREGINGGPVKAGVIKVATEAPGITPGLERILRAAAVAHRETGAPLSTHTDGKRGGLAQQDFFERQGVDLTRVIIGHCGDSTDLDYLRELMNRGSYIGMDRFGLDALYPPPYRVRAQVVADLCAQGFETQILLSHDANCFIDWCPMSPELNPDSHFRFISETVLPLLRECGVGDEQLHTMMVENPRRIFEHAGAY